MEKQLSDKQKKVLRDNGFVPENMTYQQGSDTIGRILTGDFKSTQPKDVTKQFVELDRDRLIVRQSCLKAAIEKAAVYVLGSIPKRETEDILKLAEEFEDWVFR